MYYNIYSTGVHKLKKKTHTHKTIRIHNNIIFCPFLIMHELRNLLLDAIYEKKL